eukprot:TRINITY_DN13175_c0_g1_i4.p1 TRINITY_DN13175_c0_g1~~TRINITY_DN13175_c0_g1_i4.p1  ORF type:complete len:482 (-),score=102.79 TRINITY_DN13175_c0_g1_i4:340-1785(-)
MEASAEELEKLWLLKTFRLLRLLRLVRLLVAFRELYVLLSGLSNCFKTLVWASLLVFLMTNIWSIISVEYLHALILELKAEGKYDHCSWCATAFQDVFRANVTWFQIISGDGWSALARPLIEVYPGVAILFISKIFIVMWGLLNLIIAAIVDASIRARENDVASLALVREACYESSMNHFSRIVAAMDQDQSGDISVQEFVQATATNEELRHHLQVMGMSDHELHGLMDAMDKDGNGVLGTHELIESLTAIKNVVPGTSLFCIDRYVKMLQGAVKAQSDKTDVIMNALYEMQTAAEAVQEANRGGSLPKAGPKSSLKGKAGKDNMSTKPEATVHFAEAADSAPSKVAVASEPPAGFGQSGVVARIEEKACDGNSHWDSVNAPWVGAVDKATSKAFGRLEVELAKLREELACQRLTASPLSSTSADAPPVRIVPHATRPAAPSMPRSLHTGHEKSQQLLQNREQSQQADGSWHRMPIWPENG